MIRKGLVHADQTMLREWESTGGLEHGNNMTAFEKNHDGHYNVPKGLFKNYNEARETSWPVAVVIREACTRVEADGREERRFWSS